MGREGVAQTAGAGRMPADDGLAMRLLLEYHGDGDLRARERLIELQIPVARALARRFAYGGEQLEDLVQVAVVAMIKAIDRIQPARGNSFAAFAIPTVLGELRRYQRDSAWPVRVPRRLQQLGVVATPAPLPENDDESGEGMLEPPHEAAEDRLDLASAFRVLDQRERRVVHLYFFAGLSQAVIAEQLELSQIHVSRVLRSALDKMRHHIEHPAA